MKWRGETVEDTETRREESGGIIKLHHDKQEKAAGYSQRDKVVGISQRGEVVGKVDVTRGMQSSQLVDSGDGERSERTRGVDLVRVERRWVFAYSAFGNGKRHDVRHFQFGNLPQSRPSRRLWSVILFVKWM